MKKLKITIGIAAAILFAACLYVSCSNSAGGNKEPPEENQGGSSSGAGESVVSSGAITESGIDYSKLDIKVKASAAAFPADFVRGFDASTVYAIEKAGMKYLDADGKETDIFKVLKASGVNMVRLRIWNDPSKDDTASKQGNNNLEVTKALAKRATDAGLKYMLDFHFSDTWADPSSQKCPDAWKGITTADAMKEAIANFVETTLNALKESATLPAMVQLGNECEGGILLSNTANDDVKGKAESSNFKAYINAAAEKVRAADPNIKIVMHASRGGNKGVVDGFIKNTITAGITCDYIGLSYYPFFTSHGTLEELKANIKAIKAAGKKAIISETSFCWTCDHVNDGMNNQLWYYSGDDGLVQATKSLVDSSGELVMGLTTTTKDGRTVIEPTTQNHYNAVAAVMEAAAQAGADGVFYWGGDWITSSAGNFQSAMENQSFWNYDHKILDSAAVFSYGTPESNVAVGGSADTSGGILVKDVSYTANGKLIEVCPASKFTGVSLNSITISIANVAKGNSDGEWWISYDIGKSEWASIKKGDENGPWDESIKGYRKTIDDSAEIAYFKANGIKIGMLSGLAATVTITYE